MASETDMIGGLDPRETTREASALLAATLRAQLHLPGARDAHRAALARVVGLARQILEAIDSEEVEHAEVLRASAYASLVRAYAARAEDARHGAGQLSLGSQRAPTREDCDDGWRRVASIVAVAEESAQLAQRYAGLVDSSVAQKASQRAAVSAEQARRLLDERNNAYTFHADPGFSFGEGWYLAAAAVLSDAVTIQIEPDKAQTAQAERFLRDAGLSAALVPYRSRPRANKHLPEIVAQAFRADAASAQRRLRAAFLGEESIPEAIRCWADGVLGPTFAERRTVLLWLRYARYHAGRNTNYRELCQLAERALDQGLTPVLIGDALQDGPPPTGAVDMTLFWRLPLFQGEDMRRAQLQLFEHLRVAHGLVGQLGVTTAGMDGPALLGLPTMYLTDEPNVRLGRWVGAIPGYEEIVRDGEGDFLERISETLDRWAKGQPSVMG